MHIYWLIGSGVDLFCRKITGLWNGANVGNWQWAAGVMQLLTLGFSIRNPTEKIWRKGIYIRKWIPEFELGFCEPMVNMQWREIERLRHINRILK
jgi:deoxyribodipyrimidine photo-lyase